MFETKGNTTRHLKVDWVESQLAGWASQCGPQWLKPIRLECLIAALKRLRHPKTNSNP
jgi:hypothetical protein